MGSVSKEKRAQIDGAVARLNSEKLSPSQIARAVGYSYPGVVGVMNRLGITPSRDGRYTVVTTDDKVLCSRCLEWCDKVSSIKNGKPYVRGVCKKCHWGSVKVSRSRTPFSFRANSLKSKCKPRQVPFDLTASYLERLYREQRGSCFYTDTPMTLAIGEPSWEGSKDVFSVDRIIPTGGYVVGNVVLCTNRINKIKSDITLEEMAVWMPGWWVRIQAFLGRQREEAHE